MILGHISCNDLAFLPKAIKKGLIFLRDTDFSQMPSGRVVIDGEQCFAEIVDTVTHDSSESHPEAHQKYIDIHYVISGTEYIGTVPDMGSNIIFKNLMPERDLLFYEDVEHETFVELFSGSYVIFFPNDVHRPCCHKGSPIKIRKVIVKIAVDLLNK